MATRITQLGWIASFCLILPATGSARAGAPQDLPSRLEQLEKEILDLSEQNDQLYRRTPICDGIEEEPALRAWATREELQDFRLRKTGEEERLRLADGRPSSLVLRRFEISGRDPYEKVSLFLRRLGSWPQLIELEGFEAEAADDALRYTARLGLVCFRQLDDERKPDRQALDQWMESRLSWVKGERQLLIDLGKRSDPGGLTRALDALYPKIGDQAVALTRLRWGPEVVLEGVVRGARSRDRLRPALDQTGFRVTDIRMAPAGICETFSAKAQLEVPEETWEDLPASGNGLFDGRTAGACEPVPSLGKVKARGAGGTGGALTLHLRDVDVIDLFAILHDLTPENFVVDPGLRGRISVDVEGATVEETLAALRSAGMAVGPGPLRQVFRAGSRPEPAARPARAFTGDLLTVDLRAADLAAFLCTLHRISQRPVRTSREVQGLVHLFARDLPWDQILDGMAAASGWVAVFGKDGAFVGPAAEAQAAAHPDALEACKNLRTVEEGGSRLTSSFGPSNVGAGDLELAGVAHAGEDWKAYAYSPRRRFLTLVPGEELADAKVSSVDSTGVTFATDTAQELRVPFQP